MNNKIKQYSYDKYPLDLSNWAMYFRNTNKPSEMLQLYMALLIYRYIHLTILLRKLHFQNK